MRCLLFELRNAVIVVLDVDMIRLGEHGRWHCKLLDLRPLFEGLFGTLQSDYVRVLRGRII